MLTLWLRVIKLGRLQGDRCEVIKIVKGVWFVVELLQDTALVVMHSLVKIIVYNRLKYLSI